MNESQLMLCQYWPTTPPDWWQGSMGSWAFDVNTLEIWISEHALAAMAFDQFGPESIFAVRLLAKLDATRFLNMEVEESGDVVLKLFTIEWSFSAFPEIFNHLHGLHSYMLNVQLGDDPTAVLA